MEEYIDYVEKQLSKWEAAINLVNESDLTVSPYRVNHALAVYQKMNVALLSEYHRAKILLAEFNRKYTTWWDSCYLAARSALNPMDQPASKWASTKEIESYARAQNTDRWHELEIEKNQLEEKVSFVGRLLDAWKGHKDILIAISNNMRTELRALGLQNDSEEPKASSGRTLV